MGAQDREGRNTRDGAENRRPHPFSSSLFKRFSDGRGFVPAVVEQGQIGQEAEEDHLDSNDDQQISKHEQGSVFNPLAAEPEEGQAGELAAALDALSEAEKRALNAEKEKVKIVKEVEDTVRELESAVLSKADKDLMEKVKAVPEAKEKVDSVQMLYYLSQWLLRLHLPTI